MSAQARIVAWILSLSVAYRVASALMFNLVVGPFASVEYLEETAWSAVCVATPYALLYLAYRLGNDPISFRVFAISALVAVMIGGLLYMGGFGPNDGEYALVFIATPLLQIPFVLVALVVSVGENGQSSGLFTAPAPFFMTCV